MTASLPQFVTTFFALLPLCAGAGLEEFSALPEHPRQGELIVLHGPENASSARLRSRTVPVYKQEDSTVTLGLMPVPVLAKAGAAELQWLDSSGAVLHTQPVEIRDAHYPVQNVVLTPGLAALRSSPNERQEVGEFLKERSTARFWPDPFHIEAPLPGCITSPFGVRRLHNGKPTGEYHAGLDQRGTAGTPIRAITDGEVKLARQYDLRGGTVALNHGQGLESIYLHMSKTAAVEGSRVKAGETIGFVGSTGRSTAPHLHWTMYVNGEPVNPGQWIKLMPCASAVKKSLSHERK